MRPAVCPEQVASACVVLAAARRVGIAAPVRLRKYICSQDYFQKVGYKISNYLNIHIHLNAEESAKSFWIGRTSQIILGFSGK